MTPIEVLREVVSWAELPLIVGSIWKVAHTVARFEAEFEAHRKELKEHMEEMREMSRQTTVMDRRLVRLESKRSSYADTERRIPITYASGR